MGFWKKPQKGVMNGLYLVVSYLSLVPFILCLHLLSFRFYTVVYFKV